MRNVPWVQVWMISTSMALFAAWAILTPRSSPLGTAPSSTATVGLREATEPVLSEAVSSAAVPVDLTIPRDPFFIPLLLKEKLDQRNRPVPPPPSGVGGQADLPVRLPLLQLQGVVWGMDRPQAIINRQIVSAGDILRTKETAGEIKVLAITPEGVRVAFQGREFQLKEERP